jgi:integrase
MERSCASVHGSSLIGDLIRAHNVTVGEGGAGELLPHARLHDLRHVHATTLLLAGGLIGPSPGSGLSSIEFASKTLV